MNIVLFKDPNSEMLGIEINQETVFYGNYWDFSAPADLEKLLHKIQKINPDVKVTTIIATIDGDDE